MKKVKLEPRKGVISGNGLCYSSNVLNESLSYLLSTKNLKSQFCFV